MDERRSEPRIESSASVVMTPLAAVTTRLHGSLVNVSTRGIRVHFDKPLNDVPKAGEVYRVHSGDDLMLWGRGRYWYSGGIYWPGMTAFILGLGATFLFSNSDLYASPLMTRFLGGTDLSFEAGLMTSGLVYYYLRRHGAKQRVWSTEGETRA